MAQPKMRRIVKHDGAFTRLGYARLLTLAREAGIDVRLNSGYRSIKKQWQLWYAYKRGRGALAAFPGRSTHNRKDWRQGLDIDMFAGAGIANFRKWTARHGMHFDLTVRGEGWHVNARRNYDKHIIQMWEAREKRIEARKRDERRRLEEDRRAKRRR